MRAVCTASSTSSTCWTPTLRVSVATSRPYSCRKKCSTRFGGASLRSAPAISRISIRAPGIIIGISCATWIARSQLSAVTIMKPPTTSLDSTKAPSVTPVDVTTLPPGFSLSPMSTMLSLNFSFQALKAAYISCICAGDGICWLAFCS